MDSFIAVFDQAAAATSATLSTPNVLKVGRWITLTATVSAAQGLPTGRVVIHEGSRVVGTAKVNADGTATFRMRLGSAGVHTLTADYVDDENFLASSGVLALTVQKAG